MQLQTRHGARRHVLPKHGRQVAGAITAEGIVPDHHSGLRRIIHALHELHEGAGFRAGIESGIGADAGDGIVVALGEGARCLEGAGRGAGNDQIWGRAVTACICGHGARLALPALGKRALGIWRQRVAAHCFGVPDEIERFHDLDSLTHTSKACGDTLDCNSRHSAAYAKAPGERGAKAPTGSRRNPIFSISAL